MEDASVHFLKRLFSDKRALLRAALLLAGAYFAFVTGMLFERSCTNAEADRLWRDVADSAHRLAAIEAAIRELRSNLATVGLDGAKSNGGAALKNF